MIRCYKFTGSILIDLKELSFNCFNEAGQN